MNGLQPPRRTAPVSLTPLIDVVFILLMFFMLTSSFVRERQINLDSPGAGPNAPDVEPRQLLLHSNGELVEYPGNAAFDSDRPLAPAQPLLLIPAADTTVQTIVTALEQLRALGFERANLASPPASDELTGG